MLCALCCAWLGCCMYLLCAEVDPHHLAPHAQRAVHQQVGEVRLAFQRLARGCYGRRTRTMAGLRVAVQIVFERGVA